MSRCVHSCVSPFLTTDYTDLNKNKKKGTSAQELCALCAFLWPALILAWFVARSKNLAQLHARLVQLRLRSSNRNAEHLRDLFVFVTFNVVQQKDSSISRR